jgi:hypothetical protein
MMRTACSLDPSVSIRLCIIEHQQSSKLDSPWSNISTVVAAIYPEEEIAHINVSVVSSVLELRNLIEQVL